MMNCMSGMGWMMAAWSILWLLLVILAVLGIAALAKYLRRRTP